MVSKEIQLRFGFRFGQAGAHSSRTIMLNELELLFSNMAPDSQLNAYRSAIENDNILNKRTGKTRKLTCRDLVSLYGLDVNLVLFRTFRRLWDFDEGARPVLACQLALVRDPLLYQSQEKIYSLAQGEQHTRKDMEDFMAEKFPDRFSPGSLKSLSANINASWTQAGFLIGHSKKYRSEPNVRPANLVYALFIAYLQGVTGNRLFASEWLNILQSRQEELLELAVFASHAGLINFKHASEIIEVDFPDYLTKEERVWLHE